LPSTKTTMRTFAESFLLKINMLSNKINAVERIWEADFRDVPWMAQSIDVETCGQSVRYLIMVEGGDGSLEIIPFRKSSVGTETALSETEYSLSLSGDNNSIILDISQAVEAGFIRIRQPAEVVGLARIVCLKQDESGWRVIYNSLDREKSFLQKIKPLIQNNNKSELELYSFIQFLVTRDFKKSLEIFEKSNYLKSHRQTLEKITSKFYLQLNAHGIKKTFKFWSESEKRKYLKCTADIMQALEGITPHVSLGFGAVLGYVREKDLIGHDDDLDIIIAFDRSDVKDLGEALLLTSNCLQDKGFQVDGEFFSHLWVKTDSGSRADVFAGLIEEDGSLSFYPSERKNLKVENVFPTAVGDLYGVDMPLPAQCDIYLEKTYGVSWSKPDIKFNHPWNREQYADIRGVRNRPILWTRGELQFRERQAIATRRAS